MQPKPVEAPKIETIEKIHEPQSPSVTIQAPNIVIHEVSHRDEIPVQKSIVEQVKVPSIVEAEPIHE